MLYIHNHPLCRQRKSRLQSTARDGCIWKGHWCSVRLSHDYLRIKANISSRAAAAIGTDRMEVQARKFYSQRNMYLTGFTLFLSLILNRMYIMILDQLRLEDKLMKYEGKNVSPESEKLGARYRADEIGQLKKKLEQEKTDKENLKKQCEGLQKEYDDLSVRYNQTNPGSGTKKGN
jgi:B-cell receptor-associated protein 31